VNFFTELGLQEILIVGLGIVAVVFILKKLFKLAIIIAVVIAFVYYGLPVLENLIAK
jgi:hypothetical protein